MSCLQAEPLPRCDHVGKMHDQNDILKMLEERDKVLRKEERKKLKEEWGEEDVSSEDASDNEDGVEDSTVSSSDEEREAPELDCSQRDCCEPSWELVEGDDFIHVVVALPGVESAADIDADVVEGGSELVLSASRPAPCQALKMRATLPAQVDLEVMNTTFNVDEQKATFVFLVAEDEEVGLEDAGITVAGRFRER